MALPSLLDIARVTNAAVDSQERAARGRLTLLLYGVAKTGKTRMAALLARIDHLKTVYWIDCENGIDTLFLMHQEGILTDEHMAKIIPVRIADTRESPQAITTLLRTISSRKPTKVCFEHGRVDCADCKKIPNALYIDWDNSKLDDTTLVVIDSLSQVGTSSLNAATIGKPSEYKLQLDDYGASSKWCTDLLTSIQAATNCHFLCITHAKLLEDESGRTVYMPLMGSSTTSANVAKYFNTVVYLDKKLGKHQSRSKTNVSNAQTGSRIGIDTEAFDGELDLALLASEYFPASEAELATLEARKKPAAPAAGRTPLAGKPNIFNAKK